MMDRYWINQPSENQPLHHLHGLNVLAPRNITTTSVTVYPVKGETVSLIVLAVCLSRGWKKD